MRSRVATVAVLGTVLALPACGHPLGIDIPVCDTGSSAVVLSAQALPGTAFVPCINSLRTDWEYEDLRAERGRSEFSLGSLNMGMPFLRVVLEPTCDTSGAKRVTSDEAGAPLYVDVDDDDLLRVTVVTDDQGPGVTGYASDLVGELDGSVLGDRTVVAALDTREAQVTARIEEAHEAGAAVLVVTVRDSEERTVTILLPGEDVERTGVPVAAITENLRGITRPASYTGSWYYPFANGCVVYTFDAHGSGVANIEEDVKAALGLYDAEAMRQGARKEGYDVR